MSATDNRGRTAPPRRASPAKASPLSHGSDAAGGRFVRPGFAWSHAQDVRFALGWPWMMRVVDGDPADEDPAAALFGYMADPWGGRFRALRRWPREMAHRMLRLLATPSPTAVMGPPPLNGWVYPPTDENRAAAAIAGEPSEDELRAMVRYKLGSYSWWGDAVLNCRWPFLIEALYGPDRALSLILDELEAMSRAQLERAQPQALQRPLYLLGYLLLRVHRDAEAGLRARLAALSAKWVDWSGTIDNPRFDPRQSLDALTLVLHGGRSAPLLRNPRARGLYELDLAFVVDDPALVDRVAGVRYAPNDHPPQPDVRHCFLGTRDAMLEAFGRRWRRIGTAEEQADFVDDVGEIQSPRALDLILDVAVQSRAKAHAAAWFGRDPQRSRAFLEDAAREPTQKAAAAKKILATLP